MFKAESLILSFSLLMSTWKQSALFYGSVMPLHSVDGDGAGDAGAGTGVEAVGEGEGEGTRV